jgi:hypothetical protein
MTVTEWFCTGFATEKKLKSGEKCDLICCYSFDGFVYCFSHAVFRSCHFVSGLSIHFWRNWFEVEEGVHLYISVKKKERRE